MLSPEQQRWLFLWYLSFFYCRVYGKFRSLLPLLPYTWTCFLVWREKRHPPTSLHLGFCTTCQLTNQSVTRLIDCYRRVVVNKPDRTDTQTPSLFTSLRNYQYQNQFIIPFAHRAGENFWIRLELSLCADSQFARLPHTSFSCFTCCHYLTD